MEKYVVRPIGIVFELIHPDGYWIGPGLGEFRSAVDAALWCLKDNKVVGLNVIENNIVGDGFIIEGLSESEALEAVRLF